MTIRFSRIALFSSKMLAAPLVLAGLVVVAPASEEPPGEPAAAPAAPTTAEGHAALGQGGQAPGTGGGAGPPLEAACDSIGDQALDRAARALFGEGAAEANERYQEAFDTWLNKLRKFKETPKGRALGEAVDAAGMPGTGQDTPGVPGYNPKYWDAKRAYDAARDEDTRPEDEARDEARDALWAAEVAAAGGDAQAAASKVYADYLAGGFGRSECPPPAPLPTPHAVLDEDGRYIGSGGGPPPEAPESIESVIPELEFILPF